MTLATALALRSEAAETPTRAELSSFNPQGWFPPRQYRYAFRGDTKAQKQSVWRWRNDLPDEQKDLRGKHWWVRGDAVLPQSSRAGGMTLAEFVERLYCRPVPDAVKRGDDKQRRSEANGREVLRLDLQFKSETHLKRSTPAYFREFERVYGSQVRALGFSPKRSAMLKLRRRAAQGEPLSGKFKCGRQRDDGLFDAEILEWCIALDSHGSKFKVTGAYSIYERGKARAWKEGKVWRGSPGTFARRLKEATPEPIRRAGRDGQWPAEACTIPKVHRDRTQYMAGEVVSLDGRKADQFVRVPRRGGGWRLIRPIDICFFDLRTGKLLARHCTEYESADATLAALYRLVSDNGAPARIETDNGKGFVAALTTSKAWRAEDRAAVEGTASLLGIEMHRARPKEPWVKIAESCYAATKETDRQAPFFVGGSPSEKPEDVGLRARCQLHEVPTFEQYRAQRERDYALYNSTPREALDGLTPNIVFEQCRSEIRRIDPGVLEFVCTRPAGSRKIGRDGVTYRNIIYGAHDEEVWRLQGRRVWLRTGPDASFIWLCNSDGKPLAIATKGQLSGATAEDLKRAERHKAKLRKITREYLKGRDFILGTKVGQVREVMAEHRAAEEAELRKRLPEPPTPAVRIAGADLVEPVKRVKRDANRRAFKHAATGRAGTALEPASKHTQTGFDRLTEVMAGAGVEQRTADDDFDISRHAAVLEAAAREQEAEDANPWDRFGNTAG